MRPYKYWCICYHTWPPATCTRVGDEKIGNTCGGRTGNKRMINVAEGGGGWSNQVVGCFGPMIAYLRTGFTQLPVIGDYAWFLDENTHLAGANKPKPLQWKLIGEGKNPWECKFYGIYHTHCVIPSHRHLKTSSPWLLVVCQARFCSKTLHCLYLVLVSYSTSTSYHRRSCRSSFPVFSSLPYPSKLGA